MKKSTCAGMLSGLAALAVAAPCFAEPATSGSLQLGLGFRYGMELNEGNANPWGSGLGFNGGYTLPVIPIYLGGNIEYFFGNTVQGTGFELKSRLWQIHAEGGYDIGLTDFFVLLDLQDVEAHVRRSFFERGGFVGEKEITIAVA